MIKKGLFLALALCVYDTPVLGAANFIKNVRPLSQALGNNLGQLGSQTRRIARAFETIPAATQFKNPMSYLTPVSPGKIITQTHISLSPSIKFTPKLRNPELSILMEAPVSQHPANPKPIRNAPEHKVIIQKIEEPDAPINNEYSHANATNDFTTQAGTKLKTEQTAALKQQDFKYQEEPEKLQQPQQADLTYKEALMKAKNRELENQNAKLYATSVNTNKNTTQYYQKALQNQTKKHQEKTMKQKETHETTIKTIKDQHAQELSKLKEQYEAQLKQRTAKEEIPSLEQRPESNKTAKTGKIRNVLNIIKSPLKWFRNKKGPKQPTEETRE